MGPVLFRLLNTERRARACEETPHYRGRACADCCVWVQLSGSYPVLFSAAHLKPVPSRELPAERPLLMVCLYGDSAAILFPARLPASICSWHPGKAFRLIHSRKCPSHVRNFWFWLDVSWPLHLASHFRRLTMTAAVNST